MGRPLFFVFAGELGNSGEWTAVLVDILDGYVPSRLFFQASHSQSLTFSTS